MTDHDLLTKAYGAFNARDIDAALWMMHPDVDWPNEISSWIIGSNMSTSSMTV